MDLSRLFSGQSGWCVRILAQRTHVALVTHSLFCHCECIWIWTSSGLVVKPLDILQRFIHNSVIQGVSMNQLDFKEQLKVLLAEYRTLSRELETAPDKLAVQRQMQDCVRRQNALREQIKIQGE